MEICLSAKPQDVVVCVVFHEVEVVVGNSPWLVPMKGHMWANLGHVPTINGFY